MNGVNRSYMVPGFNHNIKHNGHIYHIQTEDSGVQNPHIITHLFVGGNILATKKTSYADIVHAENLIAIVKELMQEQHKAMLRNLINGVYDNISPAQNGQAAAAERLSAARKPTTTAAQPTATQPTAARPTAAQPTAARPTATQPTATQPTAAQPTAARPTAAQPTAAQPTAAQPQELPPAAKKPAAAPPVAAKGQEPIILPQKPQPQKFPPAQFSRPGPSKAEPVPAAAMPTKVTMRVTPQAAQELPPEVLAARRLSEKPKPKDTSGPTIFGESLISEKSLDEVILGYLAGNEEDG